MTKTQFVYIDVSQSLVTLNNLSNSGSLIRFLFYAREIRRFDQLLQQEILQTNLKDFREIISQKMTNHLINNSIMRLIFQNVIKCTPMLHRWSLKDTNFA